VHQVANKQNFDNIKMHDTNVKKRMYCFSTAAIVTRTRHNITLYVHWLRVLRRRSAVARLLRSWVRIPLGTWMFVCYECCVLSGRGLCDELITRPEESYRLWWVVVCDQETSRMRRPYPALGRSATVCVWETYIAYVVYRQLQRTKKEDWHNPRYD